MTKITQEKFLEMVKGDKEMAKRLADYLGGETDASVVGQKTAEFAKKEGYELMLSDDELANVSGGLSAEEFNKWANAGASILTALTQTGLGIYGAVNENRKQNQQQQQSSGDDNMHQDANGTWISNDGKWRWDGNDWIANS
jgi:hypothetical protein